MMTLIEIESRLRELSLAHDEAMDCDDHEEAKRIDDEMDAMAAKWNAHFVEGASLS